MKELQRLAHAVLRGEKRERLVRVGTAGVVGIAETAPGRDVLLELDVPVGPVKLAEGRDARSRGDVGVRGFARADAEADAEGGVVRTESLDQFLLVEDFVRVGDGDVQVVL